MKEVSVRRVLAQPAQHFGQKLNLVGWARVAGAEVQLYADEHDGKNRGPSLCLSGGRLPEGIDGKYLLVEGTLRSPTALADITRALLWSDPRAPRIPRGDGSLRLSQDDGEAEARRSIVPLLERPDEFHGREIEVVGFMAAEPEDHALYVSEEAYRHGLTKEAIWVKRSPELALHETYVRLSGRFDRDDEGRRAVCSGAMRDVSHIARLSSR